MHRPQPGRSVCHAAVAVAIAVVCAGIAAPAHAQDVMTKESVASFYEL